MRPYALTSEHQRGKNGITMLLANRSRTSAPEVAKDHHRKVRTVVARLPIAEPPRPENPAAPRTAVLAQFCQWTAARPRPKPGEDDHSGGMPSNRARMV